MKVRNYIKSIKTKPFNPSEMFPVEELFGEIFYTPEERILEHKKDLKNKITRIRKDIKDIKRD